MQLTLILAITVVPVALPGIEAAFDATGAELILVNSAYGLTFGGLLLVGGRLSDRLGRKRIFTVGLSLFGAASLVAGLAPGAGALIGARLAQGCGAALTAPAALSLLGALYPDPARRARAAAVWGGLAGIGAVSGVVVSGFIVAWTSWRWVFALPVAVAAIAGGLTPRFFPGDPPRASSPSSPKFTSRFPGDGLIDAVPATAGLLSLGYGLSLAADHPWLSSTVLGPASFGAALLAAFVLLEARVSAPLLPLSLFASRSRVAAYGAVLLASAGSATVLFFFSLYFQQIRGFSPVLTSAAFLPFGGALIATGAAAGRLAGRTGPGVVTVAGLLAASIGLLALGRVSVGSPYIGAVLGGLVIFPVGLGLVFAGATVLALAGVPEDESGIAGGVLNTVLEAGPALGLAVLASLAGARSSRLLEEGHPAAVAATGGFAFALHAVAIAFFLAAAAGAVLLRPRRPRPGPGGAVAAGAAR